jgi:hypothetical protein
LRSVKSLPPCDQLTISSYPSLSSFKVLSKKNRKRKRTDSKCTVSERNSSTAENRSPETFSQWDGTRAESNRIESDWDGTVKILYSALTESETDEERARRVGPESCQELIRNAGPESCQESIQSAAVMDTSTCGVGGRKANHGRVKEVDVEVEAECSVSVGMSDSSCTAALLHCAKLLLVPRVLSFITHLEAESVRRVYNTNEVHRDGSVIEVVPDRVRVRDVCQNDQDVIPDTMCNNIIDVSPASSSTTCPSNSVKSIVHNDVLDQTFGLACIEGTSRDLSVSFTVTLKGQNKSIQSPFAYYFEISVDAPLPCGDVNPNPIISISMRRTRNGRTETEAIHDGNSSIQREVTELKGGGECEAAKRKGGYLLEPVSKCKVMELFQAETLRTNRR